MCLGLGLKSHTGSRRIVETMNIFGHYIYYHIVESIEAEIATGISHPHQALLDGLTQGADLLTGLAWDIYDENTETLSGAGTLHDTVGICYQTIPEAEEPVTSDFMILEHTCLTRIPLLCPIVHSL